MCLLLLIDREASGSVESGHVSEVSKSVTDELSLPRNMTTSSVCLSD